jgi:hypothetical protein
MEQLIQLFGYICALLAAIIVGNWFLAELRKARAAGKPWYAVYATTPGLLVLFCILVLPFIAYLLIPRL